MRLKDKVAIVTGAGSGIGRAISLRFSEEGTKTAVVDCVVEAGEETARMIKQSGGDAIFITADVAKASDVEAMVKRVVDEYGGIQIVCNNAGIMEWPRTSVIEMTEETWDRVVSVNLKSMFLTCKYSVPEMIKSGGGSIINMSSVGGLVGGYHGPAYCASKGGVIQLTKALAIDHIAQNVRVNCVCPGTIGTSMFFSQYGSDMERAMKFVGRKVPMRRLGEPKEIADAVLYLASEESSYVTGAVLVVDGGALATG